VYNRFFDDWGDIESFEPMVGNDIRVRGYGHFDEPIGSIDAKRDLLWTDVSVPDETYLTECKDGEWQTTVIPQTFERGSQSWGDFNGDGCFDYVWYDYPCCTFGRAGDGHGETFLGNCDGTFTEYTGANWDVLFLTGKWTGGMAYNSSDWNNDGNQDIIFWSVNSGGSSATTVWYLPGDGLGNFGEEIALGTSGVAANSSAMGDINGDGNVDLVLGPNDDGGPGNGNQRNSGEVWVIFGDGNAGVLGNVKLIEPYDWLSSLYGDGQARLWDYDKDGDLDLLVSHNSSNGGPYGIGYFLNDGFGNFTAVPDTTLLPYFTWRRAGPIVPIHQE
jgi:hypothetical protein